MFPHEWQTITTAFLHTDNIRFSPCIWNDMQKENVIGNWEVKNCWSNFLNHVLAGILVPAAALSTSTCTSCICIMPVCECLSSTSSLPAPTTNHVAACSNGAGWLDDPVCPSSWPRRPTGRRSCRLTCCGDQSCHTHQHHRLSPASATTILYTQQTHQTHRILLPFLCICN